METVSGMVLLTLRGRPRRARYRVPAHHRAAAVTSGYVVNLISLERPPDEIVGPL